MLHHLIELALWLLAAYILGCLVGWVLRRIFGRGDASIAAPAATVAAAVAAPAVVAAAKVAVPAAKVEAEIAKPAPVASPVAAGDMERPRGLKSARGGKADDLQRISGVGPKNEAILHNLGVFHFDQIAAWTAKEVSWVDDHLRFGGRIQREEWIRQGKLLAEGKEEQFTREFGTGGLKGKDGQTQSGSHTRKG